MLPLTAWFFEVFSVQTIPVIIICSLAILTWISNFHPLTASSVSILVKEIVKPSRKNLWHASHLTSSPDEEKKWQEQ